jgi:regulator of Ty1 transposition protein 109
LVTLRDDLAFACKPLDLPWVIEVLAARRGAGIADHSHVPMNLRDHLVSSLSTLPGSRSFHLLSLVSVPRKHNGLYPHASVRPKVFVQDILILLSEHPPSSIDNVVVSAIEAQLYTLPSTNTSLLYISKVDSTAQGLSPSPTRALVTAFIKYYADAANRPGANLWVHIFARSQSQYLFPNSAQWTGKKVLSDVKLCRWWKDVMQRVTADADHDSLRLYYVIPGFSEVEAERTLAAVHSSAHSWTYGHPYNQDFVLNPFGLVEGGPNISNLIPSFPDDPKTRFLAEIAADTPPKLPTPSSPRKLKRARIEETDDDKVDREEKEKVLEEQRGQVLNGVSTDEFWERMGFRQECSLGAMTAFFVAIFRAPPSAPREVTPPEAQPGQIPTPMLARITSSLLNHDFGDEEKAKRSTAVLEGSVKGLCLSLESDDPDEDRNGHPSVFEGYIDAVITTTNPPLSVAKGGESEPVVVNVLQVRKKKKRE